MKIFKSKLVVYTIYLSILNAACHAQETSTDELPIKEQISPSVTQTVYGFLDFTTTIGNTVMVFSPQSAATSTSAKPTEPLEIIKEKPSDNVVSEIIPSKAVTQSIESENPPSFSSSESISSSENRSVETVDKTTTISQNSTIKIKSGKPTPKSLPINSPAKPAPKEKPKSASKPANTTHKAESTTEAGTVPQIASTKKPPEKKNNTKSESAPKTTPKPVNDKNKPPSSNSTIKSTKPPAKPSVKPKSTTKTTSKPTSPIYTSPTIPQEPVKNSVVVASKVEVREGPTIVQKVKKPEVEAFSVQNSSSSSVAVEEKTSTSSLPNTNEPTTKLTTEENQNKSTTSSESEKKETTSAEVTEEPAMISSSGVSAPEYDYLSRQPSEVVDETYRVIDLKPNGGKNQKSKPSPQYRVTTPDDIYQDTQPLGLISSVSDSIVIGTVIDGKYAQVLQSNAHVQQNAKKIKPSPSIRILKTVAPTNKVNNNRVPNLEPTPTYDEASSVPIEVVYNGEQGVKASRKPSFSTSSSNKNKYSNKNKAKDDYREDYGTTSAEDEETLDTDYTNPFNNPTPPTYQTSTSKKTTTKKSSQNNRPFKLQNRFSRPTTPEIATVSVFSEGQSSVTPSFGGSSRRFTSNNNRRSTNKYSTSTEAEKIYQSPKRSFKSKIGPSNVDNNSINPPVTPSIYKFKLNRPTGRWQYKTSPKPRVTIRRQDENLDNVTVSPVPQFTPDIQLEGSDQELSGSGIYPALQHEDNSIVHDVTPSLTAETLRVEISTPADFKDVYYEIATIKSPYSFKVGNAKNTRYVTVTSTFEKSLVQATETPTPSKSEPLSENILASTHNAYDKEPPLDSSIATLPPIGLAGDAETPPLETMTESFSTTQLMLKTHILPVIRGGSDTTRYTLVQSYHVTRLVTATKTLPPMEVYQFVPSKTLNEFNTRLDEAGSEVHLELDFGDNNEHDDEPRPNVAKALLSDLDLTNIGSEFDITDVDKNKIIEQHLRAKKAHHRSTSTTPQPTSPEAPTTPALSPEQLQQLAILRLLNPNAPSLPNVITSSKPILKVETAYETHIIPIFNGGSTFFTTISRPTATVTKTEYEYVTATMPLLQSSLYNPLFPQPSFQVTTTPLITQTMVTETDTKLLKLTFGAKTSYTTLYSTRVTPTILTTYLTNSVPVQPTISPFPGFYNPAAYGFNAGFPFVG